MKRKYKIGKIRIPKGTIHYTDKVQTIQCGTRKG